MIFSMVSIAFGMQHSMEHRGPPQEPQENRGELLQITSNCSRLLSCGLRTAAGQPQEEIYEIWIYGLRVINLRGFQFDFGIKF